ncbi:imidazole glycerol phosphate synthase subunit HisH [Synechococcus elongatus]|uniref:Imidazole glycerol phosphate synthase subunit HisH n=2 Tax=Synechococcus elongatus TaxID=32046 RepID=HIS5_SYNE7|nr:imidazole glycerol phosphate synthase subunit HisH [Synechococcus elongatus]Q31N58.1 RecName: Full=Imidazole glycerol phosphate synthase subunit HisH; AltName: Full=IGP synthase glutaminase subunit; AltName: Full=IGP synthase subunit HisH; AltName: Full=ImGP synthase subunit HisH; Short=IGPS subunit HisH [Synechococcus elongatus PCC 7942 = FACHB-805]Q5MZ63.1 RecName: Full=Imidazole glycerol phosphate synthase subunit HisH; AltName: Full=IGP synthase glutaminase subunit; AltName: Full=IGP synth
MASTPQIAVVDYDMGNLHSACKGLEAAGANPIVTADPATILAADGVLLPGVGAFDPAMDHLRDRQLIEPLHQAATSGKPFLGICLGLQLLFEASEEGQSAGLGILPGRVQRFRSEPGLVIPHMGWNQLQLQQPDCPLWQNLGADPWFYFVHTYYVVPSEPTLTAATVQHGSQPVTAAIARDRLWAVQFHPEKSAKAGLQLLANFVTQVAAAQLQTVA